jgi:hypothetical protein
MGAAVSAGAAALTAFAGDEACREEAPWSCRTADRRCASEREGDATARVRRAGTSGEGET